MFSIFSWLKKRNEPDRSLHPQVWLNSAFGEHKEIAFQMHGASRPVLGYWDGEGNIATRGVNKDLGLSWAAPDLMTLLLSRSKEYELGGIKAEVLVAGQEGFYLPMVDFVGRPTEYEFKVFFNQLVEAIPSLKGTSLVVFDSTNSYHGYVFHLLSSSEWEEYIYFLAGVPIVDKQWADSKTPFVLRWTKDGGRKEPRFAYEVESRWR